MRFNHFREGNPYFNPLCISMWLKDATFKKQLRYYFNGDTLSWERIKSVTICVVDEDDIHVVGYSFCCLKDQFNRKIGCHIARNRALKDLEIARKNRANLEQMHQESILWPSMDVEVPEDG